MGVSYFRNKQAVDSWNDAYAPKTEVDYFSYIIDDDRRAKPERYRTKGKAFLSNAGTAVVFLEGYSGFVALSHVFAVK